MEFDRTESIVLYTCTVLFLLVILLVFYRLCSVTLRKLCGQLTFSHKYPFIKRSPELTSEDRVRQLLDRPSVRELLARRARSAELNSRIQIPDTLPVVHKPEENLEDYPPPPSYDSVAVYAAYEPPPPYQERLN